MPEHNKVSIMFRFSYALGRTLLLSLALCVVHATAWADEFDREISFDIAPQSLAAAILDFAEQSKIQVVTSGAALEQYRTNGLKGRYSVRAALKALLSGTDLEFREVGGSTVSIEKVAPTAAIPRSENETAIVLDTVIVTAQKRAEPDQTVPITMTALSERALDIYRVGNLSDLSRLVPGLLISTFSENSPTIAIRGASNTFEQIGVSKPVAIVVDDVFVPRASGSVFELFDLASLNVLEGPQGTLFGRNVTGGAIVIETRNPTFGKWGATAEATAGNWGDLQYNALANVPLSSFAALNVSASVQRRDGYGEDRLTGGKEDDINSQNFRAKLLVAATDSLSILISADHSYDYNGDRTLSSTLLGNDGDPRTSELGVDQHFSRVLAGGSAKATWQATAGEITSISAYRSTRSNELYSGVGANYSFLTSGSQSVVSDDDQVRTFTQELRYASPKWQRGDFVAGFYYVNESGHRELGTNGLAARTGALAASTLADEFVQTTSYAGFADGTLHIVPSLDMSVGVRYTVDRKTAGLRYSDFIHIANTFDIQGRHASWSQSTPRAVLSWHPGEKALVYTSVTRGFTAGGFNSDAASPRAFAQTFEPETVTSYELGTKTQWLHDTLRLDASLFEMKYHDKQELVFNTTNGILDIVNAAAATSKGFEVTAAYKPLRWLEFTGGYTRLMTRYDSFVLGSTNNTGHMLSSSPPNKYSISSDVDCPVGVGFLVGSANYSWLESYNTGAAADPRLQIPSYGLINLNVGYETSDRRYRLSFWSRNVGNTNYILTRSTQVITAEYLGEPRTFGVTLRARF
jgi:iron complex outermembrane recepter protein